MKKAIMKEKAQEVKNKKKITEILNENNFSIDECIQIVRIFLIKAKKLLSLSIAAREFKSIDKAISSHKPPIFWKEKEIVKKQAQSWSTNEVKNIIFKINRPFFNFCAIENRRD